MREGETMGLTPPLLRRLRAELAREGTPERAEGARRYMKSEMPFHGVSATVLRAVCKKVFPQHPLSDAAAWRDAILGIWRRAKFREERYAAIELAGDRRAREFEDLDALPMYEEMIVTGAWWDTVDALSRREALKNVATRSTRSTRPTRPVGSRPRP
jgi:3-methyladenine DNA glycosylase AlkD